MPPDLGVFNTYTTDVEQGIFRINKQFEISNRIRDDTFQVCFILDIGLRYRPKGA
jgi:hypothetical protein